MRRPAVVATVIVCTTVVAPTCGRPNVAETARLLAEAPTSTTLLSDGADVPPRATQKPAESIPVVEHTITHKPVPQGSTERPREPISSTTTVSTSSTTTQPVERSAPTIPDDLTNRQYRLYEKSADVVTLQQVLGVEIVDGIYGPITRATHVESLGGPESAVHVFYPEFGHDERSEDQTLGELIDRFFRPKDRAWATRVAFCESSGLPHHTESTEVSSALAIGWFQHLAKYWSERSVKAGVSDVSPFDPEANVAVAAWLYYASGPQHWNPSRTCWENE